MSAPTFDAGGAVLSYVRARGSAPEDEIIAAAEAAEEAHHERIGVDTYENAHLPNLLYNLVQAGRLRWRDAPGRKGDLSAPLIYSLSARERGSGGAS